MATNRVERMYVEIVLGIDPKDSTLKPLSQKEMAQWDTIKAEVAQIRNQGGGFEIPNEIPDGE